MTAKLRQLREKRAAVWADMSEIMDRARAAGGKIARDDSTRYDVLEAELDYLSAEVRNEERSIADGRHDAASGPGRGPDAYAGRGLETDLDGQAVPGQPLTRSQTMESYVRARGLVPEEESRGLSFDRYVRGIVTGNWDGADAERRAMSEGTTTAGGHLVPTILSSQIIDLARAQSVLLSAGAQLVPMESQKVDVPKWTGDPTAAWRNEAASITPSDGTLSKLTLTAQSLAAMTVASRELLEDAPVVQSRLAEAFAKSFALKVDLAGLRGTGTAPEPRGVLNTSGITTTSLGTNGATPTWDNIVDNVGTLIDLNESPNALISAPRTWRSLAKAKDSTNQYIVPPASVRDLPQFGSTQLPKTLTVGTSSDCSELYVGDWSQVYIGVRTQLQIMVLTERYADTGQVGFVAWWRGDIGIARPAAFNVVTGVRP